MYMLLLLYFLFLYLIQNQLFYRLAVHWPGHFVRPDLYVHSSSRRGTACLMQFLSASPLTAVLGTFHHSPGILANKMHWIKDLFQRLKNDNNVFPAAAAPIFLTESQVKSLTLLSLKKLNQLFTFMVIQIKQV